MSTLGSLASPLNYVAYGLFLPMLAMLAKYNYVEKHFNAKLGYVSCVIHSLPFNKAFV